MAWAGYVSIVAGLPVLLNWIDGYVSPDAVRVAQEQATSVEKQIAERVYRFEKKRIPERVFQFEKPHVGERFLHAWVIGRDGWLASEDLPMTHLDRIAKQEDNPAYRIVVAAAKCPYLGMPPIYDHWYQNVQEAGLTDVEKRQGDRDFLSEAIGFLELMQEYHPRDDIDEGLDTREEIAAMYQTYETVGPWGMFLDTLELPAEDYGDGDFESYFDPNSPSVY